MAQAIHPHPLEDLIPFDQRQFWRKDNEDNWALWLALYDVDTARATGYNLLMYPEAMAELPMPEPIGKPMGYTNLGQEVLMHVLTYVYDNVRIKTGRIFVDVLEWGRWWFYKRCQLSRIIQACPGVLMPVFDIAGMSRYHYHYKSIPVSSQWKWWPCKAAPPHYKRHARQLQFRQQRILALDEAEAGVASEDQ